MRDTLLYIRDMVAAIESIEVFVSGMDFDAFKEDDKTLSAVLRKLEVLGEASKQVPPEIRERAPEIPWREMAGMRDKLIHFYFGVDAALVWRTVTEKLPELKPRLQRLLGGAR